MITFDEAEHRYFDSGVELRGVTHIIRFLNIDIAAGAQKWRRDAAADRGKRIHDYCADIDLGADPDAYDWDCAGYIAAYKSFLRDYRPRWSAVEMPVGAAELGFAGTIDRVGYIDNQLAICDLKTGSKVNKVVLAAQLTGYEMAYRHLKDCEPVVLLYGVHLKKDGKYTLIRCNADYELFQACLLVNQRMEG